jgi:NAD(P)-dependent dehydrogenase (short-subunit alcohol dehydrogenase family)
MDVTPYRPPVSRTTKNEEESMSGAVIIGAGPGIGQAVARRFAREGLPITLIARSGRTLLPPPVLTLRADSTDQAALTAALDRSAAEHGIPDVVVYNAAIIQADAPGELSVRGHMEAWAVNVIGALNAAAHVAPDMRPAAAARSSSRAACPNPSRGT